MQKVIVTAVIVALVVGAAAFYGGMSYAKNAQKSTAAAGGISRNGGGQGYAGFSRNGGQGGRGAGGGFASGEILSNDGQSLVIKLRQGGSQNVFLDQNTEVSKFVAGTAGDLQVGMTVMATGTANQDGSLMAKTIQVRPAPSPENAPTGANRPSGGSGMPTPPSAQ